MKGRRDRELEELKEKIMHGKSYCIAMHGIVPTRREDRVTTFGYNNGSLRNAKQANDI